MSIKVCGFNFHDIKEPGDEVITEFREFSLKVKSNDFLIQSHSFYEIQIFNDLKKFVINSSLKESLNAEINFVETISDVQLTDENCFFLHDNGKVSQYNLVDHEVSELSVCLTKPSERLIYISSRFDSLYGISNLNCIYQLLPQHKIITTFPKHQKIKKISSGLEHTLLLTSNGDVYSFGCGLRGQLGHGDVISHDKPKLIEALSGIKIIDIDAAGFFSYVVSSFGDAYSFGWDSCGQLGLKKTNEKGEIAQKYQQVFSLPQIIDIDDETDAVKNVYCGKMFTILRTERNRLFSTGSNKYGQLAVGDTVDRNYFIEIPITPVNNDFKIICGNWSTYLFNGQKF